MAKVRKSARLVISQTDTIRDIAADTHYTAGEIIEILRGVVDQDRVAQDPEKPTQIIVEQACAKCRPVMSEANGVARLVCSNCGSTLDVGAKYCSQCGSMVCDDDGQSS